MGYLVPSPIWAERFKMKINSMPDQYSNCVFLGGICSGSNWRAMLIRKMKKEVPFFDSQFSCLENAVQEKECKNVAKIIVFIISCDELDAYSGFKIHEEAIYNAEKLVFSIVGEPCENQKKEIQILKEAIAAMGCHVCDNLDEIAEIINREY